MAWMNLDRECALAAANIAQRPLGKSPVKLLTECGSVLSAQGPYAFALYLRSKPKDPAAGAVLTACGRLISQHLDRPLTTDPTADQVLALLKRLSEDLDKLLLAKSLLTQVLAYLKYEIKGRP